MEKFYSKIDPEVVLHMVVRKEDFKPGRIDLIAPDNFIQCSLLNFQKGKTFQPHKHIWKKYQDSKYFSMIIAQESWYVQQGKVKCIFYDFDESILATEILNAGDASFTLCCGHNYEILEDDTKILEYKTGPYEGQEKDKVFI